MAEYPISYDITKLRFVTEDQYRNLKFNGDPAFTIEELMAPGVLEDLSGQIYVWNNDNGWTGDEDIGVGSAGGWE